MRRILRQHLDPRDPNLPRWVAGLIGATCAGILQAQSRNCRRPGWPRAPRRSKRRKGKRAPYNVLIDTGFLRASVAFEVNIGADSDE